MVWCAGARAGKGRESDCNKDPEWGLNGTEHVTNADVSHQCAGPSRRARLQNPNCTSGLDLGSFADTGIEIRCPAPPPGYFGPPQDPQGAGDELPIALTADVVPEQRVARDLHDVSGQYFVGIMLRLAALELLATDPDMRESLCELHATVARFRDEVRALCQGQRCAPRGDDLVAALADLIPQWEQEVGISARFDREMVDSSGLDDETAETVFRVVQEALTNVAKHAAEASQVSIRLRLRPDHEPRMLSLEIEDDGVAQHVAPRDSHADALHRGGIVGMRERVAELGGHFTVRHRKGKGTRVIAMIPVRNSATGSYGG